MIGMDICRQKGSRISRAACVAAFVCAGVVACWGTTAFGDITAYLQNDVRITGDQIHHYTDAGKTVTVVVGNFLLQVGPRQISGQDAVVWIDTSNHDRAVRHAIAVYVEGDARVIEPGRLTRDKYLLVKLKVQGRISAKGGTLSTASLKDVPFYARAKKTRAEDAASLAAWREKIRSMGLRESSQAVAVRRSVGAKVDSPTRVTLSRALTRRRRLTCLPRRLATRTKSPLRCDSARRGAFVPRRMPRTPPAGSRLRRGRFT